MIAQSPTTTRDDFLEFLSMLDPITMRCLKADVRLVYLESTIELGKPEVNEDDSECHRKLERISKGVLDCIAQSEREVQDLNGLNTSTVGSMAFQGGVKLGSTVFTQTNAERSRELLAQMPPFSQEHTPFTGELRDAYISAYEGKLNAHGKIYSDVRNQFEEGEIINTTRIVNAYLLSSDCAIIKTISGSIYKITSFQE